MSVALQEVAATLSRIHASIGAGRPVDGDLDLRRALHALHLEGPPDTSGMADLSQHGAATAALVLQLADALELSAPVRVTAALVGALHVLGPYHHGVSLRACLGSVQDAGPVIWRATALVFDRRQPEHVLTRGACLFVQATAPAPGLGLSPDKALERIRSAIPPEVAHILEDALVRKSTPRHR